VSRNVRSSSESQLEMNVIMNELGNEKKEADILILYYEGHVDASKLFKRGRS